MPHMWRLLLVDPALARTWSVPTEGTFTGVVAGAAAYDIIVLDPGIYADAPAQIFVPLTTQGDPAGGTVVQVPDRGAGASIAVLGDLVLQDLTLDGLGLTQILQVYDPSTLTLERVTLQYGVDPFGYGGAIGMGTAQLTATDTVFLGNASHDGGAVFHNGPLLCTRCTFEGNSAVGVGGDGGGLWTYGPVTLIEPVFSGNSSALWHGGALSVSISADIYGGSFLGNTAALDGGAIAIRNEGVVTVLPSEGVGATFEGNTASSGGAIGCDGSCTLSVTGARFASNAATFDGGHVSATQSLSMSLTDSVLEHGTAGLNGGAVAVDLGPLSVLRTELCHNGAGLSGGALWSDSVDLDNVSALYNTAALAGGALSAASGTVSFTTAAGNEAPDGSAAHGRGGAAGLLLSQTVLVDQVGGAAVGGAAPVTVLEGATWNNAAGDYAPYAVTVGSSLQLTRAPFPGLDPAGCAVPVPEWSGELPDDDPAALDTLADLDGSGADPGATGGPLAEPSLWVDGDQDGIVVMWDCDDLDEQVFPPECAPVPLDTGPLDTGPLDTGLLDTGQPHTGISDTGSAGALEDPEGAEPPSSAPRLAPERSPWGAVGCGCRSSPPRAGGLFVLLLALSFPRRATRLPRSREVS
jgi:predicted outer membrane repeat protein